MTQVHRRRGNIEDRRDATTRIGFTGGRPRVRGGLALLTTLALAAMADFHQARDAAAATRAYFRDWLVACPEQRRSSCAAYAYVHDRDAPDGVAARVRVVPGTAAAVGFSVAVHARDVSRSAAVRVDREPWLEVPPGGDLEFVEAAAVTALLRQMKAGAAVTLRYVDKRGDEHQYRFSLFGLRAALGFIEGLGAPPPATAGSGAAAGARGQAAGPMPLAYRCLGSAPSWSAEIDENIARYAKTDAAATQSRALVGSYEVRNRPPERGFSWRGGDSGWGELAVDISERRCRDASGKGLFAYSARLSLPHDETLLGCCRAGAAPHAEAPRQLAAVPAAALQTKPVTDWSRLLPALRAAVAACLGSTPGSSRRVTKAWPAQAGTAGVRTRNGEGDHWECIARSDGSQIVSLTPLAAQTLPAAGEDRLVFTPADDYPPDGDCYLHERVVAGDELLGWLSSKAC